MKNKEIEDIMGNYTDRFINYYMDIARRSASMSYSQRAKVGAVIVKDNYIISCGYNGMPKGYNNCCEIEINGDLITNPLTIHAEDNAISRAIERNIDLTGASLFCTHSPCKNCSEKIIEANISHVFYECDYRSSDGIKNLINKNVIITKVN